MLISHRNSLSTEFNDDLSGYILSLLSASEEELAEAVSVSKSGES